MGYLEIHQRGRDDKVKKDMWACENDSACPRNGTVILLLNLISSTS